MKVMVACESVFMEASRGCNTCITDVKRCSTSIRQA